MDDTELLKMSGLSAGSIAIILLIYRILKTLKGKRFISVCCQKKLDIGFDVGNVETPKHYTNPIIVVDGTPSVNNPERKQTERPPPQQA
jgi:hypothetical protein